MLIAGNAQLQWGRGEIPRKGSGTRLIRLTRARFNGAAVRYRGKGCRPSYPPYRQSTLQWGRGEIPRKGRVRRMLKHAAVSLQWGRGEIPRKGKAATMAANTLKGLQWGRGEIPRKGGPLVTPAAPVSVLQWGRGEIPRKGDCSLSFSRRITCFNGAAVRYRGKGVVHHELEHGLIASMGPR